MNKGCACLVLCLPRLSHNVSSKQQKEPVTQIGKPGKLARNLSRAGIHVPQPPARESQSEDAGSAQSWVHSHPTWRLAGTILQVSQRSLVTKHDSIQVKRREKP